ncbi:MAG: hypothetical protein JXQ87_07170 [Bacteroidia bacterium]
MKKTLLIISAILGLGALICSIYIFDKLNIMHQETLSLIEKENIQPTAISGGLRIGLLIAVFPLLGIIITGFFTKKQKGAGWILLFNILVFLYCIFGGITILNSWQ